MDTPSPDHLRARQFTRLWVGAQPVVAAYVFAAVRQRADAEDVLQTVAEAALEDFDKYDPAASFTGWALGIARYRVLNHHRNHKRDRHVFCEHTLDLLAASHQAAEPLAESHRQALAQCLKSIPRRQHAMLMQRYRDDQSMAQIGERRGMSANAVAIGLHRIRQALAQCIRAKLQSEARHG
ncbi:MAG: sigma-70 family RNA polymerase sigma factor [Planctomycetes bacterium]|nr:sigma-70 family RNA polymerase sigma factor [Planctomycetota bacterium]